LFCFVDFWDIGFGGNSGVITVFINGVPTEVPRGPMDIKTAFGEDVMLVHSSGMSLPTNEFGFLMLGLQHGESYFVVRTLLFFPHPQLLF